MITGNNESAAPYWGDPLTDALLTRCRAARRPEAPEPPPTPGTVHPAAAEAHREAARRVAGWNATHHSRHTTQTLPVIRPALPHIPRPEPYPAPSAALRGAGGDIVPFSPQLRRALDARPPNAPGLLKRGAEAPPAPADAHAAPSVLQTELVSLTNPSPGLDRAPLNHLAHPTLCVLPYVPVATNPAASAYLDPRMLLNAVPSSAGNVLGPLAEGEVPAWDVGAPAWLVAALSDASAIHASSTGAVSLLRAADALQRLSATVAECGAADLHLLYAYIAGLGYTGGPDMPPLAEQILQMQHQQYLAGGPRVRLSAPAAAAIERHVLAPRPVHYPRGGPGVSAGEEIPLGLLPLMGEGVHLTEVSRREIVDRVYSAANRAYRDLAGILNPGYTPAEGLLARQGRIERGSAAAARSVYVQPRAYARELYPLVELWLSARHRLHHREQIELPGNSFTAHCGDGELPPEVLRHPYIRLFNARNPAGLPLELLPDELRETLLPPGAERLRGEELRRATAEYRAELRRRRERLLADPPLGHTVPTAADVVLQDLPGKEPRQWVVLASAAEDPPGIGERPAAHLVFAEEHQFQATMGALAFALPALYIDGLESLYGGAAEDPRLLVDGIAETEAELRRYRAELSEAQAQLQALRSTPREGMLPSAAAAHLRRTAEAQVAAQGLERQAGRCEAQLADLLQRHRAVETQRLGARALNIGRALANMLPPGGISATPPGRAPLDLRRPQNAAALGANREFVRSLLDDGVQRFLTQFTSDRVARPDLCEFFGGRPSEGGLPQVGERVRVHPAPAGAPAAFELAPAYEGVLLSRIAPGDARRPRVLYLRDDSLPDPYERAAEQVCVPTPEEVGPSATRAFAEALHRSAAAIDGLQHSPHIMSSVHAQLAENSAATKAAAEALQACIQQTLARSPPHLAAALNAGGYARLLETYRRASRALAEQVRRLAGAPEVRVREVNPAWVNPRIHPPRTEDAPAAAAAAAALAQYAARARELSKARQESAGELLAKLQARVGLTQKLCVAPHILYAPPPAVNLLEVERLFAERGILPEELLDRLPGIALYANAVSYSKEAEEALERLLGALEGVRAEDEGGAEYGSAADDAARAASDGAARTLCLAYYTDSLPDLLDALLFGKHTPTALETVDALSAEDYSLFVNFLRTPEQGYTPLHWALHLYQQSARGTAYVGAAGAGAELRPLSEAERLPWREPCGEGCCLAGEGAEYPEGVLHPDVCLDAVEGPEGRRHALCLDLWELCPNPAAEFCLTAAERCRWIARGLLVPEVEEAWTDGAARAVFQEYGHRLRELASGPPLPAGEPSPLAAECRRLRGLRNPGEAERRRLEQLLELAVACGLPL